MASYNSSDVTDMIRSKRVFLGTYCPPSSSCGGGGGGTPGGPGATGPAGNSVLNGVGAPSSAIGSAGDFYIDTSAYVMYGPKYSVYYSTWSDMGNSLYIGPNRVTSNITLPSTNSVTLTVLPATDLNITFAAYDNNYVLPTLQISNITAGTPSSTANLNVSHYLLSTGNQYQLTYTCSTGNTLTDVRFQNYYDINQQVVWTNNPWFVSVPLIGPGGPAGGPSGPTGPTGATGPSGTTQFDGGGPSSVYKFGPVFDCGTIV